MSTTTAASGENGWTDFPAANLDDERWRRGLLAQQPEHRPGEVALERAERFQAALTGPLFALQVGASSGVAAALDDRDCVQRAVELPVAVAVESVAALLAGATPANRANCASLPKRPAPAISPMTLPAISAPQPSSSSSCGA